MSINLSPKGQYNNIPESLMPKMPEDGTIVTYEFLTTFFDPITRKQKHQQSVDIAPFSRVKDPKSGKFLTIGLFSAVDNSGQPVPQSVRRIGFNPAMTGGFAHITIGNSAEGNELYQYMELTSENESNPNRDPGITPLFRKVDYEEQALRETKQLTQRYEAIQYAMQLEGAALDQATLVMGFATDASPAVKRARLAKYAEENPADFKLRIADEDAPLKALIQNALNHDVLYADEASRQIKYRSNNTRFADVGAFDNDSVVAQGVQALKLDEKGHLQKTLKALVTQKAKAQTADKE